MDFDSLYLLALKYLTIRPRSEKEIRDYLSKKLLKYKNEDASMTDLIVHQLKQQKFLNDADFAKMWIRSRTQFRPKGKYVITLELKQKGISQDVIDEAFAAFDKEQEENKEQVRDEVALATEVLEHKKKKYEAMDRQERFAKAGSMLARRGFSLDTIKKAIDSVFG